MSRRKQPTVGELKQVLGLLLALIFAGAVLNNIKNIPSSTFEGIAGFAIAALGLLLFFPLYQRSILRKKIRSQVDRHLPALQSQRAQKLQKDPYGSLPAEKWHKEIRYFLDSQILPITSGHQRRILLKEKERWIGSVASYVEECETRRPTLLLFDQNMTGGEFEVFCAKEIEAAGWNARVTLTGRDQGADIIADKNGERLVVQCKKYSSPVGNKAVQEVAAAKSHQGAKYAIVVTNNTYTSAAKQLAATNGVKLLHFSDLRSIDTRLAN